MAPENLCGAVRFGDLTVDGSREAVAEGYQSAFRSIWDDVEDAAGEVAYRFVDGTPEYGREMPDVEALLDGLAERYDAMVEEAIGVALLEERDETREIIAEDARGCELAGGGELLQHRGLPDRSLRGGGERRAAGGAAGRRARGVVGAGGGGGACRCERVGGFGSLQPHGAVAVLCVSGIGGGREERRGRRRDCCVSSIWTT